jgi:hypothetical protein
MKPTSEEELQLVCDKETQRQIRKVYDELYEYLLIQPLQIWETDTLCEAMDDDRLETMQEMLQMYTETEDFSKCKMVHLWMSLLKKKQAST